MLGCGGVGGVWWTVATGMEMAVLPPETWAASVVDLSQDLSAPEVV